MSVVMPTSAFKLWR